MADDVYEYNCTFRASSPGPPPPTTTARIKEAPEISRPLLSAGWHDAASRILVDTRRKWARRLIIGLGERLESGGPAGAQFAG